MEDLIRVGDFTEPQMAAIDREFACHTPGEAGRDEALRASVRGFLTRSNIKISSDLLETLPALRIVATSGVGFDGIPVAWARERGIVVTNTPGVLDAAVCELGVGLLLALLREIPQADRHVRTGAWRGGIYPLTTGLTGKRVGIVGLGRIGKGIAERLLPFGPSLAYAGRAQPDVPFRHFPDARAMASEVDVLVITCKGGPDTRRLINAEVLAALGPGYLVNLARGSVVDEAALCDALVRGSLRGAALDVFEEEPLGASPLLELPNVLLSPHAGSATHETRALMLRLALDNLHAVLGGGEALTPV
jgi:lactate dehydrogenase-like 2-hydroxyacid dehydrogenase